MADSCKFDPVRDGFSFPNPVGLVPDRTGGGETLRRFDAFVYGKGLCFGMAAAALSSFSGHATRLHPPLAALPLSPDLIAVLQEYQLRQFYPRVVLATVRSWLSSGGGRPERVFGRARPAGANPDPHVLCFGPAPNRRFFSCLARAHAVVPYRVEEGRIYVYDPNHPRDRERCVQFSRDGREFVYDGFRSREGWGITLVPVSACLEVRPRFLGKLDRVDWRERLGKRTCRGGGKVNQGQERPLLVETWLGSTIFVEYVGGQSLESDALRRISAEDSTAEAPQIVKTSFLVLENYNSYGIEVRFRGAPEPHFLPWGAILRIASAEPEIPQDREEAPPQKARQMEEGAAPRDRQELMDRLANAGTPSELSNARAAADSWLASNPSDGDVRLALERLGAAVPEEDLELEEGSPT
jgi:hypothetical protein